MNFDAKFNHKPDMEHGSHNNETSAILIGEVIEFGSRAKSVAPAAEAPIKPLGEPNVVPFTGYNFTWITEALKSFERTGKAYQD